MGKPAKVTLSDSAKLRASGRKSFKKSFCETSKASTKVKSARQALRRFNEARAAAADRSDAASAARNTGLALWRLATLLVPVDAAAEVAAEREYRLSQLEQALETLIDAATLGAPQPPPWRAAVVRNLQQVHQNLIATLLSIGSYDERARKLERLIGRLGDSADEWKFALCVNLADTYFKAAVSEVDASRAASQFFRGAIRYFKECNYPLEEAKLLYGQMGVVDEYMATIADQMDTLAQDVPTNLRIAEGFQALGQGDELLRAAVEEAEELCVEGVFCALDKFREAGVCGDVELEAVVYSRLGGVYLDVLKIEKRAHEYLMKCAELAESLMPRNFHGRPWFDSAMSKLASLRLKANRAEERAARKNREPHLEELKSELKQLAKLAAKSAKNIIVELPILFPPEHKKVSGLPKDMVEMRKMDTAAEKKLLQKLIFFYHPDHVDQTQHGMKYFVLCEEITKVLTGKYECFKGCAPSPNRRRTAGKKTQQEEELSDSEWSDEDSDTSGDDEPRKKRRSTADRAAPPPSRNRKLAFPRWSFVLRLSDHDGNRRADIWRVFSHERLQLYRSAKAGGAYRPTTEFTDWACEEKWKYLALAVTAKCKGGFVIDYPNEATITEAKQKEKMKTNE